MAAWNQYRLLENVEINEGHILLPKTGSDLILELSQEGIAHIWPLVPAFHHELSPAEESEKNQDFDNYLVDGDWAVHSPWMYFNSLDEVMAVMNGKKVPVSYRDLGSHLSIRTVRAFLRTAVT